LKAIEEYSHLGAGFKIAMRDLEIRGAGNILGPEQSGHIAAVGYEMYCQLLEEAVKGMQSKVKEVKPESHVDIGISAYIPKQFIPADRQRMDVYRRLTRCTSLEMLAGVEQDVTDAFGPPPHQAIVLFALTELRLLSGLFGIESIIKKEPDIVFTVRDAAKAQVALHGAPGTVRVIDEKTVYLRMPPTFLNSETCLMTLKNLMRGAWDRQQRGEPAPSLKMPEPKKPTPGPKVNIETIPSKPPLDEAEGATRPTVRLKETKSTLGPKKRDPAKTGNANPAYVKLVTLRDQGILTEQEFQAALGRMLANRG
jgi:hypothetical protein